VARNNTALLYYVSRRFNSDLDINRVLADILDLTLKSVEASNGSILILDEQGAVVHKILARAGMPPEQAEAVVAEVLSQGFAGWVVDRRQGTVLDDVSADPRWVSFPDDELVGGSAIGVPLLRPERVVGVLTLRHPETEHFTASHLALLSSIGDQAAIAVENARLFHSVQAERAKMTAVINGAGDAILVTDEEGSVLLINAVARQAFGIPHLAELQGQLLTQAIENHALAELWGHRGNSVYPSTGEIPLPDGRTFHASLTSVPDVGFVIVMQDITYLKQLNQMKSEFVSTVSHDLRSPLQLILTYASLLSETGTMTRQQRDLLAGIYRGVQKMSDLIDDLLELGRIETGIGLEKEHCALEQVISRVLARFEDAVQDKGLALETQIAPDLPAVLANIRRMDQVISNLVDNAVKYTLKGSITVKAFADDQRVTVRVIDTGVGLMPQEQKRVFGKFYRAGNELTQSIEGTGLGLAIAKSIVEQYGGTIWVESTWQQGSTFAFSLPRNGSG
jgi:two-component system phosphate regulon sensor histidine kinase PhoR